MNDKSESRTFVSYASKWDMHKGSVGWDELDFDEQDNFIRAICSNDIDYQDKAISADIEKTDLEGLANLIVAASLILERKSVIDAVNQWDKKHKDGIISIFQGTLFGQRLETIFLTPRSSEQIDPPQIFSAELKRTSSFEQYDEMAQLGYEDFKSFSSYILTSLPREDKIQALENNLSNPEKYDDQSAIMAAILYELPKTAYYETYQADEFSQGLIKSHEARRAIQHLKEIGLVNFVTTDKDPYYDTEQNSDDALQDEFIIWLSERGNKVGLSKNVTVQAQSFLAKRQTEEDKKQATFDKRTAEARLQKIELQKEIDKNGGLVMPGIYHGNRRLKARMDMYDYKFQGDWILSPLEEDIIQAISTNKILWNVNWVDLQKKYGLRLKDEIAPVTIEISEYGRLDIKRTDEWGEGAKAYTDNTSWHEKVLRQCTLKNILFSLGLLPCLLGTVLSERITSKANRIIFFTLLILMLGLGMIIPDSYRENDNDGLILMIIALYSSTVLLPFWYNGFQKQGLS